MNKTTRGYLVTGVVALVAVAVANRIPQVKSIVQG